MKKSKLLSALLAAVLAVSSTVLPASAETGKPYCTGDLNGDGRITVSDAILLARINAEDVTVQISAEGLAVADVNFDGEYTLDDVNEILRYIAGLRPEFEEREWHYEDDEQTDSHQYTAFNLLEGVKTDTMRVGKEAEGFRSAQMDFSANLLRETVKKFGANGDNILVSPYSVALALGMTANGAKNQTLEEMEKVLGGSLKINELNESYLHMLQNVKNYKDDQRKTEISIANSIWYKQDKSAISVPEQFLKNTADYFRAAFYGYEEVTLPVIQDVNYWVNNKTNGMIDGVLVEDPDLYRDMLMLLMNTVAFEADWSSPYTADDVHGSEFTLANGEKFMADMMNDKLAWYMETEKATAFKKFYAGGDYSFVGILPNEDISAADYVAALSGEELTNLLDSATTDYDVYTSIPRFTYDFEAELNQPLSEMGMPTAFDDMKAEFQGLNTSDVLGNTYISSVIHKTHIQVDELGTKAGAVTAVIMAPNSAGPSNVKTVRLDRPFVYMIYDENEKLPIFIGTVMQPDAARPK